MAKSKGKKRTESVRERQRRLLRERRQITRRGSSTPTSQKVEKVKVKVEGQKQLTGAKPKGQLPPGKTGGALTKTQRIRRRNINTNNQSNPQTAGGRTTPRPPKPSVLASVRNQLYVKARQLGINPDRITERMVKNATVKKLGGLTTAAAVTQILLQQFPGPLGRAQRRSAEQSEKQRTQVQDYAIQKGRRAAELLGLVDPKPSSNKASSKSSTKTKSSSKSGPNEGDTKIVDNKRFVYRKGEWVNEGRPRTQAPSKTTDKNKSKDQSNNNNNRRPAPEPKPTKRTGANDPRNAAYIAARSKLNANSTKEERDKVRDMGLAIHNKKFGKKTKTNTSSKSGSTQRVNRSSSNGAPGGMSAAQREQERQRKEKEKKKKRKGRALAIGGYA